MISMLKSFDYPVFMSCELIYKQNNGKLKKFNITIKGERTHFIIQCESMFSIRFNTSQTKCSFFLIL